MPFPYTVVAIFMVCIVLAGKIKDKTNSRWFANLIALFGLIEPFLIATLIIT